jgi:hypothetical protein
MQSPTTMPDPSIREKIAAAEERASSPFEAASDFEGKPESWGAFKVETTDLRELTRLRECANDEDCRITRCGSFGRPTWQPADPVPSLPHLPPHPKASGSEALRWST